MKLLSLFLLMTLSLSAGSIEDFASKHGYFSSYEKAIAQAKKEDKILMFVLVTHYCPWCRKYERNTLSKKRIKALIHKKYTPLILNREAHQFPDKFDSPRIPTTLFIDAKQEKIIHAEMGFKTPSQFVEMEKRVFK